VDADADVEEEEEERAVWLIAPVFDAATTTTSYVVLDGRDLGAGPTSEIRLPAGVFVPWGLHGTWRAAKI
jgi:carotenoid cleavage dioxygenase-like enzyme